MTFVLRPASNVAAPRGKAVTVGQMGREEERRGGEGAEGGDMYM